MAGRAAVAAVGAAVVAWPAAADGLGFPGPAPSFTACAPGFFGPRCQGRCACGPHEDCDDGLTGDGTCTCVLGLEAACRGAGSAAGAADAADAADAAGAGAPQAAGLGPWSALVLANRTLQRLRVDADTRRTSRQVRGASASRVLPARWRTARPRLVLYNAEVAERIGLGGPLALEDEAGLALALAGQRLVPGSQPFAHAYGGHQFGSWAGQLGDGRAVSLGEALGFPPDAVAGDRAASVREFPWELALKGAGRTAYSRGGDGRAALANAAREFFAPVFLEAAGIPAVATLAVVASDAEEDRIVRDEWYDGKAARKKPGVVARLAPTFLRFGTFQLAAKRLGADAVAEVARFALDSVARMEAHGDAAAAYVDRLPAGLRPPPGVAERCFFARRAAPSCAARATAADRQALFGCLLDRVAKRTGALVAAWMSMGFAHGVMNTDNMSVLGITLDLNVFGFLASFDPGFAPNHIDDEARYAFGAQPGAAQWNVERFADALAGVAFPEDREPDAATWAEAGRGAEGWLSPGAAARGAREFRARYDECFVARMSLRFGLRPLPAREGGEAEWGARQDLVERWLGWLEASGADYPRASRGLAEVGAARLDAEAGRLADHAGAARSGELDARLADVLAQLLAAARVTAATAAPAESGSGDPTAGSAGAALGSGGGACADAQGSDGSCGAEGGGWPTAWRAGLRAAVPALAPRSHVLREAARLVEAKAGRQGAAGEFLEALGDALRQPFNHSAQALGAVWDDPRAVWRGVALDGPVSRAPGAEPPAVRLAARLGALPPRGLSRLTTSCGAQ